MKVISTDHSDQKDQVSTSIDSFIEEKAIWVATLSNGVSVYQDDGREGFVEPCAWIRLADYIRKNNLDITTLHIQFRDHVKKPLPPFSAGYFFSNKAVKYGIEGNTLHYFLIGCVEDDVVQLETWKTPELVFCGRDVRMLIDCKKDTVIMNRNIYYDFGLEKQTS